jgi:hypothetical protein
VTGAPLPDPALACSTDDLAVRLWREALGGDADAERSFIDNGGDSFAAVVLTEQTYETIGVELDYVDVLGLSDLTELRRLLTPSAR